MARALADILTELNSVYNPQRQKQQDIYNQGLESVAPQETADLTGLEQAKKNAFGSIETGANRRGLFFSGIPLEEQAKYVGENYLPGIAGLKSRYAGIRGNLYQTLATALGNLDTEQNKYGRDIYDTEVAQDIERERIAAAERSARAAGAGSGWSPYTGVLGSEDNKVITPTTGSGVRALPDQDAYNEVRTRIAKSSPKDLISDYNATYASAMNGNPYDKAKLAVYEQLRPDLFKVGVAPGPTLRAATAPRPEANVTKVSNVATSNWSPLGAGMSLARKIF